MSIKEIVEQVQSGQKTATEMVKESIKRAEAAKKHNALLRTTSQRALKRAAEIDRRIKAGERIGKLAGVPFVVKDNIFAFDGPTTAASRMLENFEAPYQATVVERLEAAGAICIGKTNMDAFAHGGSTEKSAFGPTKNAVDASCSPGGSSGGSAVAVALDVVPFALGTDTGGSIRQPASHNGVIGYKPSYGLVSRYGVIAMSSSADCVGCFAKQAADVDLITSVIAGQDKRDGTTYASDYQTAKVAAKPKIAIIKQFLGNQIDAAVKDSVMAAVEVIEQAGYRVEEIDLPEIKYAWMIHYVVASAEIASNMARYDGVRYGYRTLNHSGDIEKLYKLSRSEAFEAENKRRIILGNYVVMSDCFETYYLQAQKVRTLMSQALNKAFKEYDFLISPVIPEVAPKFGSKVDLLKSYQVDAFTTPANLAGLPALSLPIQPDSEGLPIGLQIMANFDHDAQLVAFASAVENIVQGGQK